MERGPELSPERPMSTLLYRGKTYETHHEPAPKVCRTLNYHQQHYNSCREQVARDLHPQMNYRGISYVKNAPAQGGDQEARRHNDRQTYLQIARELVSAQFVHGDAELARRLWADVGERNLDVERLNNLLYGCHFHDDDTAMQEADQAYLDAHGA